MERDIGKESVAVHARLRGKIEIRGKMPIAGRDDLAIAYTPGVGAVSSAIAADKARVDELTWRKNTVAVVSDGSAVLGLGNIGPEAALPVMEGKSLIFKQFAGIDAIPIVLKSQEVDDIVRTVIDISPGFGAIQLEDIAAPRCFEIERRLMEALDMPVMHDDQHGTAIVVAAGLLNALAIAGKSIEGIRIVLSGAGAAGTAIAKLLITMGAGNLLVLDSKGMISETRTDLNDEKRELASLTNQSGETGDLAAALRDADVFIGISKAGLLTREHIASMKDNPIIFALANPVPEIMPDLAKAAGVAIMATGRSDFPNQINNALCYPGLFRGMFDHDVKKVTDDIKLRAARAIALHVADPTPEKFIPSMFDQGLHEAVAESVVTSLNS
jgi:malate dehydrogenase (oxaloacetate-decarboxylating)